MSIGIGVAALNSGDVRAKAGTSEALFDLTKDPGEQNDEASSRGPELSVLRSSFLSLLVRFIEAGDDKPDEFIAPLTEAEREGLETLGYL